MNITKTVGEFMELRNAFDYLGQVPGVGFAVFVAINVKKIQSELDTVIDTFKTFPEYQASIALVDSARESVISTMGKLTFKTDDERVEYINNKVSEKIKSNPDQIKFLEKDKEVRDQKLTIDLRNINESELPDMINAKQIFPILELITIK